jgi:hypothetical protein
LSRGPARRRGDRAWTYAAAHAARALLTLAAFGAVASVVTLLAGARPAPVYRDLPPPGYSGGFGEQSCDACHFFNELNDPAGALVLEGVPEQYIPGGVYAIQVVLTRPGTRVGGFQLTSRFESDGTQAGSLGPADGDGERVDVTTSRGILYAHHLLPGSDVVAPDTLRWTVLWTAPEGGGAVVFPTAANAADGDDSVSGDYVYTSTEKSRIGGSTSSDHPM